MKQRAELEEKLKSSDEKKVEIAKKNENDVKYVHKKKINRLMMIT